jgi:hypothetical protein
MSEKRLLIYKEKPEQEARRKALWTPQHSSQVCRLLLRAIEGGEEDIRAACHFIGQSEQAIYAGEVDEQSRAADAYKRTRTMIEHLRSFDSHALECVKKGIQSGITS